MELFQLDENPESVSPILVHPVVTNKALTLINMTDIPAQWSYKCLSQIENAHKNIKHFVCIRRRKIWEVGIKCLK